MADDRIDTAKLVLAVEAGQGCSVLDAFDGRSLQSQIAAIADMNQRFNKADSNLFTLQDGMPQIELSVKERGFFKTEFFHETFDPGSRKIDYSCTNKTPTGDITRTVHRSF